MSQDSIILNKSPKFAARIVKLYQFLCKEKHETVISKQIIRSGTSIGANANEAVYGVSKAEFIAKLQIALKECYETEYWLELLFETESIDEAKYKKLQNDCGAIRRMLISSAKKPKNAAILI